MKKKKKDYYYFDEKWRKLDEEMIQEIIRRLDNSDWAVSVGLGLDYDFCKDDCDSTDNFPRYYCRFMRDVNNDEFRLDEIKKIGGTWVFAFTKTATKAAEIFAINGDDEMTQIMTTDNLHKIILILDEYEKRGNGIITGRDEWETEK